MIKASNPAKAGSIRGVITLSAVADTDWHDLTSADFVDSTTGSACASGLTFEWIGVMNLGADVMHIKYRARTTAGDSTTNEIAVGESWEDDLGTLRTATTTISYAKSGASDEVYIYAGFSAI